MLAASHSQLHHIRRAKDAAPDSHRLSLAPEQKKGPPPCKVTGPTREAL